MIAHSVVLLALRNRLLAVSGLPTARAFENVDFKPTSGTEYVAESFVPAANVVGTIGPNALARVSGLYQVHWYAIENTDVAALYASADTVLAQFSARTAITLSTGELLRINDNPAPWVGEAIPDGLGWCRVTVTIPWFLRTHNVVAA